MTRSSDDVGWPRRSWVPGPRCFVSLDRAPRVLCGESLAAHGLNREILTLGSNGATDQAEHVGLGMASIPRVGIELRLVRRSARPDQRP